MEAREFVDALKRHCRDAAVSDCLQSYQAPPGRSPPPALVQQAAWFNRLAADDQACVAAAMRDAADATLFGVLCVLDGVRSVEAHGEKSGFALSATRSGVLATIAPGPVMLHDILRAAP
jgi:hypothetical protein